MAKTPARTKSRTKRRNTAEELADLSESVERLTQLVQVLTQAVDELTDELQWRNNTERERASSAPPFVLHSLPRDSCTDDWHVNRVRPLAESPEPPPPKSSRGQLFD